MAGRAALGIAEAALEAWAECRPDGMKLPEERLPAVLSGVAARVPGGLGSPDAAVRLHGLFNSQEQRSDLSPLFVQMLKPHAGQVHFLYFWRAFSEAARLVSQQHGGKDPPAVVDDDPMGLGMELEVLRDALLARLDEAVLQQGGGPNTQLSIPAHEVLQVVTAAQAASAAADAWRGAAQVVGELLPTEELGPEWLAVALLSWLHDLAAFQLPALGHCGQQEGGAAEEVQDNQPGLPVYLHVYDVSQEESIRKLNTVLAHQDSPVKLGGVFHAGVEVNGLEWSYGLSLSETCPGVSCCEPRGHPQHHYRQTVCLMRTQLTEADIADIIGELVEQYPGPDYDLLRRNCCHFADDFARRLGCGGIPGWVHRLARIGAHLDGALHVAQSLHDRFRDAVAVAAAGALPAVDIVAKPALRDR